MLKTRNNTLICLAILLGVNSACQPAPSGSNVDSRILVRSISGDPETLDPHLISSSDATEIVNDLFEGLFAIGTNGQLTKQLAKVLKVSADGTRYEIEIHDTAKWSNGESVTAEDFVRGIKYAANPNTKARQANLLSPIKGFTEVQAGGHLDNLGVRALSTYRLEIQLSQPTDYFPWLLTYPITFARPDNQLSGYRLLTNGAYKLEERKYGSHVLLVKNENFRLANVVKIELVKYITVEDESSALARFRAGEIHITSSVPNVATTWAVENLANEYNASPVLGTYFYALNLESGITQDIRVRKALNLAVDRETLVRDVLRGGQPAAYSLVPDSLAPWSIRKACSRACMRENIETAKKLLSEAGYDDNSRAKLTLFYNNGENHRQIALYVTSYWSEHLPVDITLENKEFKVLVQSYSNRKNWNVIRAAWTADYPSPASFYSIFQSSSPNNISGFENANFDAILTDAARSLDTKLREKYYQSAAKLLSDEVPTIFLYHYVKRRLVTQEIKGFTSNQLGIAPSMYIEWKNPTEQAD